MAIQERDLLIPALLVIEVLGTASTSQLQVHLRNLLEPTGDDLRGLANRKDDRFSQKVRNLKSHDALVRRGWAEYEGRERSWRLTPAGHAVLDANRELLDALLLGRHRYADQQTALAAAADNQAAGHTPVRTLAFDEDEVVLEGRIAPAEVRRRERSRRLRRAALHRFAVGGKLVCDVCEFDFEAMYGERGTGYIEVHHVRPLFMYEDDDLEQTISAALENLVPLCSNCHRMLHRSRTDVWTVTRLRGTLRSQPERPAGQ